MKIARGHATGRSDQTQQTTDVDEALVGSEPAVGPVSEPRYHLAVLTGPSRGERLALVGKPGTELRIGKSSANDLQISHPSVSRHHCTVARDANGWLLRDNGSTNGTFLEGHRVVETYLRPGVTLKIGSVAVRLLTDHAPVSVPPSDKTEFGTLYSQNLRMREIFALLEGISPTDATVLITGETGTGKGALARAIHEQSARAHGPFVIVDCGAIAPTLIESELFGHERGAFTGAEQQRRGALELAAGGTLFLDELDDLAKGLQPKLLRAIEDRTLQRIGAAKPVPFDARILAASKRSLPGLVKAGEFREDLYFRLAVFRVDLPPLRDRREDVPSLVDRFAESLGHKEAWGQLSEDVRGRLLGHDWPGNLRELRNTVERALALSRISGFGAAAWSFEDGGLRSRSELEADFGLPYKEAKEHLLGQFERAYLSRLLQRCGGNISRAAREAQLDRSHFHTLLSKHGLIARDDEQTPPAEEG